MVGLPPRSKVAPALAAFALAFIPFASYGDARNTSALRESLGVRGSAKLPRDPGLNYLICDHRLGRKSPAGNPQGDRLDQIRNVLLHLSGEGERSGWTLHRCRDAEVS